MQKVYSPEQIKAIEAGEKAIPDKDVDEQFSLRDDPWALKYVDDFSTIEPVVDHHIRSPVTNHDPNSRLKTHDELVDDVANFIKDMPDEPSALSLQRFFENVRLTTGKAEAELDPHSAVGPDVFEPGETFSNIGRHQPPPLFESEEEGAKSEESDKMKKLGVITGLNSSQLKQIQTKVLVMHRVVNQTRLGKIQKAYVLVVAGNRNGLLGIGEGKSEEIGAAREQAEYRAIRSMQPVPRYERRTIFGDVKGKVAGTELILMNRPPGTYFVNIYYFFSHCSLF